MERVEALGVKGVYWADSWHVFATFIISSSVTPNLKHNALTFRPPSILSIGKQRQRWSSLSPDFKPTPTSEWEVQQQQGADLTTFKEENPPFLAANCICQFHLWVVYLYLSVVFVLWTSVYDIEQFWICCIILCHLRRKLIKFEIQISHYSCTQTSFQRRFLTGWHSEL